MECEESCQPRHYPCSNIKYHASDHASSANVIRRRNAPSFFFFFTIHGSGGRPGAARSFGTSSGAYKWYSALPFSRSHSCSLSLPAMCTASNVHGQATETEEQEQTPCAGTSKSDRNLANTVTIAIGGAKHILNTQVLPSAGNQAYTHIRHAVPRLHQAKFDSTGMSAHTSVGMSALHSGAAMAAAGPQGPTPNSWLPGREGMAYDLSVGRFSDDATLPPY